MSAVPIEIRNVPRPENTVVIDTGAMTYRRYSVRQKISDSNTMYGQIVWYIHDGKFIVRKESTPLEKPFMVSFGSVALILSVVSGILMELIQCFGFGVARAIITIAILKIIRPGITAGRMSTFYRNSYLSVYFPDVAVSKNSVGDLYTKIGLDDSSRETYYNNRLKNVSENELILIDGSHVQDNSSVNALSAPSYKECEEFHVINVIHLYSPDHGLLCSDVNRGSFSDISLFKKVVESHEITSGILVGDSGFTPGVISKLKEESPEKYKKLHYVLPLRDNDVRITSFKLTEFDNVFEVEGGRVHGIKVKVKDGLYLYGYSSEKIAKVQNDLYFDRLKQSGKKLIYEEYKKDKEYFGTIFLASDLDLPLERVYEIYTHRWDIERLFLGRKSDLHLNQTRVQGDFAVIGQEFIQEIETRIYTMVWQKLKEAGLLKNNSFSNIMEDLSLAWRKISNAEREETSQNSSWIFSEGKPVSGDDSWIHTTQETQSILEILGISTPAERREQKSTSSAKNESGEEKKISTQKAIDKLNQYTDKLGDTLKEGKNFLTNKNINFLSLFFALTLSVLILLQKGLECTHPTRIIQETGEEKGKRGRRKGALGRKNKERQKISQNLQEIAQSLASEMRKLLEELSKYKDVAKPKEKEEGSSSEGETDAQEANVLNNANEEKKLEKNEESIVCQNESTDESEKEITKKKRGVQKGTKRGKFNKDGSLRQKPGPKPGTKHNKSYEADEPVAENLSSSPDFSENAVADNVDFSHENSQSTSKDQPKKKRGVAKGTKRGQYNKDLPKI